VTKKISFSKKETESPVFWMRADGLFTSQKFIYLKIRRKTSVKCSEVIVQQQDEKLNALSPTSEISQMTKEKKSRQTHHLSVGQITKSKCM
jgi:hypothetical protein